MLYLRDAMLDGPLLASKNNSKEHTDLKILCDALQIRQLETFLALAPKRQSFQNRSIPDKL